MKKGALALRRIGMVVASKVESSLWHYESKEGQ